jgi:hypothetical protein
MTSIKFKIQSTNKIIIYNLLYKSLNSLNKNRIKHTFNIINNTLIINKNDYDTTQKLLSKSYYTQNTYKLIK